MENLTTEEKQKILKRIIICIILLIIMVIVGIVMMNNGSIVNRLKANAIDSDSQTQEDQEETCEAEISENNGDILIDSVGENELLYDLMPFNLKITDKQTGKVTNKTITNKYCPAVNEEDYCNLQLPFGTYDIEISKTGYLNVFIEDVVVDSNTSPHLHARSLVAGDLNGDNQINELDYRIVSECKQGIASDKCKIADYNFNGKVDEFDLMEVHDNYNRVYVYYKEGGSKRYYGDLHINNEDFTLSYGQTGKLTYTTSDYFDKSAYGYYSVSQAGEIIRVDNEGNVTPKKPGTAKVRRGNSNTVTITVIETGEIITDSNIEMTGIDTKQIEYNYSEDSTFKDSIPTFTSSNTNVVTVDDSGLLTSKKRGTATITMKAGLNTTKTINVTVNDLQATDIDVALKSGEIVFDGHESKKISDLIEITPTPSNSTLHSYEYSVEDPDMLTVDDGILTAMDSGHTRLIIKLKDTDVVKYVDITVNYVPIESFTVSVDSDTIEGASVKGYDYELYPTNTTDRKMTFEVTGKYESHDLFSVSKTDTDERKVIYINGQYPGSGSVTATINTKDNRTLSNKIDITITDVPINSVHSPNSSYQVSLVGYTYVSMKVYPSNYTKNHSWRLSSSSSSNPLYRTGISGDTKVWINRSATVTTSATITVHYYIDNTIERSTSFTVYK